MALIIYIVNMWSWVSNRQQEIRTWDWSIPFAHFFIDDLKLCDIDVVNAIKFWANPILTQLFNVVFLHVTCVV